MEMTRDKKLIQYWTSVYINRNDNTAYGKNIVETYFKKYKEIGGVHTLKYLKEHSPFNVSTQIK